MGVLDRRHDAYASAGENEISWLKNLTSGVFFVLRKKWLLVWRGAGIRSRRGYAGAEQKYQMSAMAAKRRILDAVNADSLERINTYFRIETDNRQARFERKKGTGGRTSSAAAPFEKKIGSDALQQASHFRGESAAASRGPRPPPGAVGCDPAPDLEKKSKGLRPHLLFEPPREAVITADPTPTMVTLFPLTVATCVLLLAQLMPNLDVDAAVNRKDASPNFLAGISAKERV